MQQACSPKKESAARRSGKSNQHPCPWPFPTNVLKSDPLSLIGLKSLSESQSQSNQSGRRTRSKPATLTHEAMMIELGEALV